MKLCPKCNKNKINIYNGTYFEKEGIKYNVCDTCSNEIEQKEAKQ